VKDIQRFKNQVQRTLSQFELNDLRFIVDKTSHSGTIIRVSSYAGFEKIFVAIAADDEKRETNKFWAEASARAACENLLKQALCVAYNSVSYKLDQEWDSYEGEFL